jgi:hypothetical protein
MNAIGDRLIILYWRCELVSMGLGLFRYQTQLAEGLQARY